ncbi:CCA tRNA nucleotidyltransferase [Verrucomicrobiota bacterium]
MNNVNNKALHERAVEAVRRLQSAGFTAFWAGGCVRDIIMGQNPKDYDIATSARPEQVIELFPGSVAVGQSFAVVRAPIEDTFFEIATFRKDHAYKDGRRPEKVSFTDPETDATRRDFTINALFSDPITNKLHDYVEGQKDIDAKVIRCVGNPDDRFREDHLRMLRAVRFAVTLDFSLEPATEDAIRKSASMITRISAERIQGELTRILIEAPKAGNALVLLDKVQLLRVILPEVTEMKGQKQPPEFHPEGDVFKHTVIMLNEMSSPSPQLAYAVLLHDVGKPPTATETAGDRIRFNGHSEMGSEISKKILSRLKFSNSDTESISYCIRNHMRFMDVQKMRRSTLRRFVGAPTFSVELELHRLDCLASHGDLSNYRFLEEFKNQLRDEPPLPKPWINGNDIIQLGISEGPEIGKLHKKAFNAQLEGQFKDRRELLEWLKREVRIQESEARSQNGES